MKKAILLLVLMTSSLLHSYSATHTIQVGVANGITFTPSSITTVEVGDVISFVWVSGSHTTTSVSVPSGAATWNQAMSSAGTFDYTVTVAGTYTYQCNPHGGSGMTGSFATTTTSTQNKGSLLYTSFELSPNPTQENIALTFSSAESFKATVLIFDETGKEKLNKKINITQGDNSYAYSIANYPKGIYFLTIVEGGTSYIAKKFIKE